MSMSMKEFLIRGWDLILNKCSGTPIKLALLTSDQPLGMGVPHRAGHGIDPRGHTSSLRFVGVMDSWNATYLWGGGGILPGRR